MNRPRSATQPEELWQQMTPLLGVLQYAMPAALLLGWRRGKEIKRGFQQFRTAMHSVREHLDAAVGRAPIGIVQTGLDGQIMRANQCYCGLVGHEAAYLRTLRLYDLLHPDDRPGHLEQHARMLTTGQPFQIETRLVRADEKDVWVASHLTVTRDLSGHPTYVIAAVQDISHRRAAEAAVKALTESLEQRVADEVTERVAAQEGLWQAQRMEALGQLSGGVAHDFNNVLQAIAGGARMIQRRPDNAAAVERLAGLIVEAAERGSTVTQRLLNFARTGPLEPGPVDVVALLTELRDMLSSTLGNQVSVQVTMPEALPLVLADRKHLETVLINLATNARDAMMEGARTGENVVAVSAMAADSGGVMAQAGEFVQITVSDTGPGMAPDVLSRATEPFFTTKALGRGTGLGLAMARGFAEQSGGKLVLRSQPGQGTLASLLLPCAPALVESAPVMDPPSR